MGRGLELRVRPLSRKVTEVSKNGKSLTVLNLSVIHRKSLTKLKCYT